MAPSPPVIVTTDLDGPQPPSETPSPATPSRHHRSASEVSDPTHLSPAAAHGQSFAGGLSPSPSVSSALTPPSPTLTSTSSSLQYPEEPTTPISATGPFRDNGSLAPIGENEVASSIGHSSIGHKRGGSFGGSINTFTTTDANEDVPAVANDNVEKKKKRRWGKKDKEGEDDEEEEAKKGGPAMSHLDPSQDKTDPTPFKEKPSTLAMLLDPKNLNELEKVSIGRCTGSGDLVLTQYRLAVSLDFWTVLAWTQRLDSPLHPVAVAELLALRPT